MQFIDLALIHIRSGTGGSGCSSFRREKFIEFGGPDGGDGGKGGNVIVRAVPNLNTLIDFKYRRHYFAKNGRPGMGQNKTGANGDDVILNVPVGTEVILENKKTVLVDLINEGQQYVIAEGGNGGWGNSRFKSSTNQAPRQANKGHAGAELTLWLKLKLLADVGLVGLPNVGKSSLLSVMSNAKPKIGDFSFTTLTPNLGLVSYKQGDFILADIPGVIDGANLGKGIGIQFLGHIERCQILVHVLDISSNSLISDFDVTLNELRQYKSDLVNKIKCVVLNKVDVIKIKKLEKIVESFNKRGIEVFTISTFSRVGINELKDRLLELLKKDKLVDANKSGRTEKWSPI
ncbi:GTPase ObgE [Paracoccaceae bacterium]|nr:GTPase ObgE [Paracoccaceae bacterium]